MDFPTPEEIKAGSDLTALKQSEFGRRAKRLTPKQMNLAAAMMANPAGTNRQWAKAAGLTESKIKETIERIEKKVGGALGEALLEEGIGLTALARSGAQFLEATNQHFIKVKDKDGNETVEIKETPNYPVRLKAFELLAKLGNLFPNVKVDVNKKIEHTHKVKLSQSIEAAKSNVAAIESGQIPAEYEIEPIVN